jgi:flap endonuclease-1
VWGKLIREYKSIEAIIKNLDQKKFEVPSNWVPDKKKEEENTDDKQQGVGNAENEVMHIPTCMQAHQLFHNHKVGLEVELKWKPWQVEELTKFLVDKIGFNPKQAVKSNIEKLEKAHRASLKPQSHMDSFFTVKERSKCSSKMQKEGGGAKVCQEEENSAQAKIKIMHALWDYICSNVQSSDIEIWVEQSHFHHSI